MPISIIEQTEEVIEDLERYDWWNREDIIDYMKARLEYYKRLEKIYNERNEKNEF